MFNKLLFLLAFIITSIILAAKYLPIWAPIALVIIYVLSAKFIVKYAMNMIYKAAVGAFAAKGEVLLNASAQIHALEPAVQPVKRKDDEDEDGDNDDDDYAKEEAAKHAALKWYSLDVSITPAPQNDKTPFSHWEPGELMLVPLDAKDIEPSMDSENEPEDESCSIHEIKIFEEGKFVEDEGGKYPGPVRMKMHIGVQPAIRKLKFRYYFKSFGQIELPA